MDQADRSTNALIFAPAKALSMSYCDAVNKLPTDTADPNRHYHDHLYGFPIVDDHELFGRLILEINQAGLSWTTILKKEPQFRRAYEGYDIGKVAAYGEPDRQRLLQDAGIIRNRLKVDAAIHNAGVILELQQQFGSFLQWLEYHHPKDRQEWTKLFKQTFRFTGGEIVNEFLMSTGFLPGAHQPHCPIFTKTMAAGAYWHLHG